MNVSYLAEIIRVGNPIDAGRNGLPATNTVLLLKQEVPQAGVVFAFSAFFRGPSKVSTH